MTARAQWHRGAVACIVAAAFVHAANASTLDDFQDAAAWQAVASDQVRASLRRDPDGSLCLDYDFGGVSGYAAMRRQLAIDWPGAFEITARVKGSGPANDLQFKAVDASGQNVWWINRRDTQLPDRLRDLRFRERHVSFAWGPSADKRLHHTDNIEFVISAGRGGRGTLCLARLDLRERMPPPAQWPAAHVTRRARTLDVDFQLPREFNGIALRWPPGHRRPLDYDVLASQDGRHWRVLRSVRASDGGLDALYLPEAEARFLRLRTHGPMASPELELRDASQWPHLNAVIAELAKAAPPGHLPRSFLGQQNYWTLVGVDGGGDRSALLGEDGAIEVGRAGYSVEPAIALADGRVLTWADVQVSQSLRDGYLPLPAVHWQHASVTLDIEAAADGPRESPQGLARYTVGNPGDRPIDATLMLAVRPWQVNPPQQFLATQGGERPVHDLAWRAGVLKVDGRDLAPTEAPQAVKALPFDGGLSLDALRAAPALTRLSDPQAHASALVAFRVQLAPGERRAIGWFAPLSTQTGAPQTIGAAQLDARFTQAAQQWRARLNRVALQLPREDQAIADTLRSTLAQILMSRDGAALKPGTRSYARSWVRDGAMMSAGLLRLGESDAARDFADWFAPHVFASGKVPCCVDARGADPVAENDSDGEYLYTVAETWRHTRDAAFLERHWAVVQRVVSHLESLRQGERGARSRNAQHAHVFGLLPPSISHEGYSDQPAYSYWDDFWALRGYKDAVAIASALGHADDAQRWAAARDEFARELDASIRASAARHNIPFVPGAADRGDFDATSTTIAFDPAQADLPAALRDATFERYWQQSLARAEGRGEWKDYTPYEWRTVGALVRLGQPARAHAMLDFFMRGRRPLAWNQWPEVIRPAYREAGFLGDLPHAWVASDFIRSALDLFAYEREAEASVVVGAGWKPEWLARGVAIDGLSTAFGTLSYELQPAAHGWRFTLRHALPGARGGVRLVWPGSDALPRAFVAGRELGWNAGRTLALPADALALELIAR